MGIKTIQLSDLEANPETTLCECAGLGQAFVVEMPDHRLIAIHPLDAADTDELTDDLLQSNPAFQDLVARSRGGTRKPFAPLGRRLIERRPRPSAAHLWPEPFPTRSKKRR